MSNTTKTHGEETSVLAKVLRPALPLDTDGLPGLEDAPAVYDLILRDLQAEEMLTNGHPMDKQDGALEKDRRPSAS